MLLSPLLESRSKCYILRKFLLPQERPEENLAMEASFMFGFCLFVHLLHFLHLLGGSIERSYISFLLVCLRETITLVKRPFSSPFCAGSGSLWKCSVLQTCFLQGCDQHCFHVLVSCTQFFLLFILSHPFQRYYNVHYSPFLLYSVFLLLGNEMVSISVQSKMSPLGLEPVFVD